MSLEQEPDPSVRSISQMQGATKRGLEGLNLPTLIEKCVGKVPNTKWVHPHTCLCKCKTRRQAAPSHRGIVEFQNLAGITG